MCFAHSKFKNVNFKTANVSIKIPDSLLTLYVNRRTVTLANALAVLTDFLLSVVL